MKNSSKLLLFFLLTSLAAVSFFFSQRQNSPQTYNSSASETLDEFAATEQILPQKISVTAENDTFDPPVLDLIQHQNVILEINAVDKDYQFIIPEFEVAAVVPQGRVTEVLLPAKALGTYNFTCSSSCSGEVNVTDNDEDAVYE